MRVKIIPHGALREKWPNGIELEAETPLEAMNGYVAQAGLPSAPGGGRWTVQLVGYDTPEALACPLTDAELHVVPAFMGGGGGGGWVKIAIGVVLIAAAVVTQQYYLLGAYSALTAGALMGAGISLVLGGILEFLSPAPKLDTASTQSASDEASRYLGGAKNTVKSGTRRPLAFGRMKLYGHYLSFDVEAQPAGINGGAPNSGQRRTQGMTRVGYVA